MKVTAKDLRDHCTEASGWIAIRGKVYDVTDFIARHPGGSEQLRFGIGRDATTVFETYHNVESVQRVLNKMPVVGELVDWQLPEFIEPSDFQRTMTDKVRKRFREAGLDAKNSYKAWMTYGAIFLTLTLTYYQQYFGRMHTSTVMQMVCSSVFGFACAQIGLHLMHDASHFSITHNPLVWKALGSMHDFVNGASYIKWIYQHALGHHPYTNIPNADPDIHVSPDGDFRRILSVQRWFNVYKYQHIYAPLLYAGLGLKTRIQDMQILYVDKTNGPIAINPLTLEQHLRTIGGKVFFLFYRIVLPVLLGFTWTRVIALFMLSDIVTSYWLALTFQANHVVGEVALPVENSKDIDWAKLQVVTTLDYAINSVVTRLAVGALNFQTVHHLFPGVLQHHYPLIQDIIYEECEKHGVKYNTKDTLVEAVGAHIRHLKNMGEKDI